MNRHIVSVGVCYSVPIFKWERSDETEICVVGRNCRGGSRFECWFRCLGPSSKSGCERRLDVQRGVCRG